MGTGKEVSKFLWGLVNPFERKITPEEVDKDLDRISTRGFRLPHYEISEDGKVLKPAVPEPRTSKAPKGTLEYRSPSGRYEAFSLPNQMHGMMFRSPHQTSDTRTMIYFLPWVSNESFLLPEIPKVLNEGNNMLVVNYNRLNLDPLREKPEYREQLREQERLYRASRKSPAPALKVAQTALHHLLANSRPVQGKKGIKALVGGLVGRLLYQSSKNLKNDPSKLPLHPNAAAIPSPDWDYVADSADEVISHFKDDLIKPPIVAGYSFGGALAQMWAQKGTYDLDSLILDRTGSKSYVGEITFPLLGRKFGGREVRLGKSVLDLFKQYANLGFKTTKYLVEKNFTGREKSISMPELVLRSASTLFRMLKNRAKKGENVFYNIARHVMQGDDDIGIHYARRGWGGRLDNLAEQAAAGWIDATGDALTTTLRLMIDMPEVDPSKIRTEKVGIITARKDELVPNQGEHVDRLYSEDSSERGTNRTIANMVEEESHSEDYTLNRILEVRDLLER
ncbi:MAG: hypothetical protein JSW08_02355 [archaeon]|nr:MAG: hypothetical protein JSW08_02355 [archaeon]